MHEKMNNNQRSVKGTAFDAFLSSYMTKKFASGVKKKKIQKQNIIKPRVRK